GLLHLDLPVADRRESHLRRDGLLELEAHDRLDLVVHEFRPPDEGADHAAGEGGVQALDEVQSPRALVLPSRVGPVRGELLGKLAEQGHAGVERPLGAVDAVREGYRCRRALLAGLDQRVGA
ncbi:MAG: hypothetical protein ACK559_15525, partial [bacterium]